MNRDPINTSKYFLLLESLKFQEDTKTEELANSERLIYNINLLKKSINVPFDCGECICLENAILLELDSNEMTLESISLECIYITYLQHTLLVIVNNINFDSEAKEDLISTRHISLCIQAILDLEVYALRQHLHPSFYTNNIFSNVTPVKNISAKKLNFTIEFFDKILSIKQFHISNSMELVIRDYMAAIYSTFLHITPAESELKKLQLKLDKIWLKISKIEYFKNLMLFKSFQQLPSLLQKKLHQELLQKLASKDGFTTLVTVLQISSHRQNSEIGNQQVFEIIANIVAYKPHSQRFQSTMIKQIFSYLDLCSKNEAMMENIGAGLLTLRRLYDLNAENQKLVADFVFTMLKKLIEPEDVLTGLIVMEHLEFCELITMIYQLFYTSSIECLPSELLIDFLPLLMEMYYNIPDTFVQKQQLSDVVARCLNNRETIELNDIIHKLYKNNYDISWRKLHKRIVLFPNSMQNEVCFKIVSADFKPDFSISLVLPALLMQANHAILTYHVFMSLLNLMVEYLLKTDESKIDVELLYSEEELITLLNSKYPIKLEIIFSLNALISYLPLKSQIAENKRDFLKLLRQLIEQRINSQSTSSSAEATDQILLIMLTLTQEFLEQTELPEEYRDFMPILKRLSTQTPNQLVQQKANTLITLLNGNMKANASQQSTAFNMARSLLETNESHLQVYGIQMFLDLLHKRDRITISNGHLVVALALTTLKTKESYTFLNCVRLFVALVNIMESEVLEILSDEYLNDNACIDFRLVVGESMLKVTQELGPLCYKYKNVLLNMFMHGARSPNDEFRMSSFANLAQLCRILCYQVLKFFQELLNLIDCELSTGNYLPSKRAALLVLSELLEGIDNLKDFEELLLPVYRLLKIVARNECCDDQMRIHATNGLKALSVKCRNFLFPEEILRKEIRFFGIKDKSNNRNLDKHILEID